MKCKSYLLSFAKAKGSIAAVALAAVLMAANATVASAQNKATEDNGTEGTVIGGVDDLSGVDPSSEICTNKGTAETDGGKRVRDAAFFFIIMLVTFAATLLKPQKYVSSRTIQKCVEHVSTST